MNHDVTFHWHLKMDSQDSEALSDQFDKKSKEDTDKIIYERSAENTRNGTKTWINLLNKYIVLRHEGNSIEDVKDEDLPDLLERFFTELKKPKGKNNDQNEPYKNSSMRVIRGGINRYLKEKRNIDIMSDDRFIRCKFLFQGVMKQNKAKGYGSIVHKNPICPKDLAKL